MKTIAFHNLGCKVNSYETDVMLQSLEDAGYVSVPFEEKADIYIVNTCSVTNIADRKSRQMLHRAKKLNPEAVVVAVGCYVQTGKERIDADDAIDLAIGNNRKKDIVEILAEYYKTCGKQEEAKPKKLQPYDLFIPDLTKPVSYEEMKLRHTGKNTRAYIKIQDGCNQFCSYCIIPFARGRVRSRKQEDIIAEATGLAEAGYHEIVLTGIHISSYGLDFLKENKSMQDTERKAVDYLQETYKSGLLLELIRALHDIPGIERIRLGSLEPRIITEEFAKALRALDKVCPHFHLSLQSGCDETLQRMNRHYSASEYEEKVAILRDVFENPAITTDVIVGFPGETDAEFAVTREYLDRLNLYEMHIFKYSKRQGTNAAKMPHQLTEAVKAERSDVLLAMEEAQSYAYRETFLHTETSVLLEESIVEDNVRYMVGHTKEYIRVAIPTNEQMDNTIVKVNLTGFLKKDLMLGAPIL